MPLARLELPEWVRSWSASQPTARSMARLARQGSRISTANQESGGRWVPRRLIGAAGTPFGSTAALGRSGRWSAGAPLAHFGPAEERLDHARADGHHPGQGRIDLGVAGAGPPRTHEATLR